MHVSRHWRSHWQAKPSCSADMFVNWRAQRKENKSIIDRHTEVPNKCCVRTIKNYNSEKWPLYELIHDILVWPPWNNLWCMNYSSVQTNTRFTVLSLVTDNNPSWISGRRRMIVEIISWTISTKVWDRLGIKLGTSGSAVKLNCATGPVTFACKKSI